jgi:hypothetical protein
MQAFRLSRFLSGVKTLATNNNLASTGLASDKKYEKNRAKTSFD